MMSMQNQSNEKTRFFWSIVCVYITFQLISDVCAGKLIDLQGFPVSVTVLFFPVTYIFADILTEVYGYALARKALWIVLFASITAGVCYQITALWPPSTQFPNNDAYRTVLLQVPRTLIGGWLAVFAGEIANNYVLAKLKVATSGKHLWLRTISSTIVGQLFNTAIFYVVALGGILPTPVLMQAILVGWIAKTLVEVLFTPITYFVVARLKRLEGIDFYDRATDFNPFSFKD
jgi:uncharacterized integral membrane protein (TIGR00697 family)